MSDTAELTLYSPLQVDVIDRDGSGRAVPLQAADPEKAGEYLSRIMAAFLALQSQEDARDAFISPDRDWSEVCDKIVSLTRAVEVVGGRLYGAYTCRSRGKLDQDDLEDLEGYCQDQWENGWGEGYAHCPREGVSLGLYIHFWHDADAPLLVREELEEARSALALGPAVTELPPDTFWTLLDQARTACDGNQRAAAHWLTERLMAMDPEQALNYHNILHGYMELADKYGLWNAAALIHEDGCYIDGFEDFRAWLIFQGKEVYMAALKGPDSLADVPACMEEDCRFPDLPYAGDIAYERLTGRKAYDDLSPDDHQRMVAELKKGIVYGAGIEYPYEWSEVSAYLPRLTAQHLTPEELRDCARRGRIWNHNDPDIQKARAAMPKQKKAKSRKRREGESR